MRNTGILCLVACAAIACGRSYPAGRTPTETIRSLEGALRDSNYAACYDLLAPEAQAQVDQSTQAAQRVCAAMPEELRDKLDLDDFCDASPRDALQEAAERAKEADPTLSERLEGFQIAVLDVQEYGERALVRVEMMWSNTKNEKRMSLVRRNSRWYLADGQALSGVPLPRPPTVDCATFT